MKQQEQNSRRRFLSTVALGAAAGSFAMMTGSLQAAALPDNVYDYTGDAEKWFDKIKGKHRIVYDGSTPHDGFPVIWTWAFYLTNNQTNTPDSDMTAVCVLRHNAIGFALNSALWSKYKLGETFNVKDNTTGEPATRNTVYEPQTGDFPMPVIQGIKDMQGRGAMFCVCDLALQVYSGMTAQAMGLDATAVYNEWKGAVLPDIQIVPSGVWALGRAQEKGCGYIFAGE